VTTALTILFITDLLQCLDGFTSGDSREFTHAGVFGAQEEKNFFDRFDRIDRIDKLTTRLGEIREDILLTLEIVAFCQISLPA